MHYLWVISSVRYYNNIINRLVISACADLFYDLPYLVNAGGSWGIINAMSRWYCIAEKNIYLPQYDKQQLKKAHINESRNERKKVEIFCSSSSWSSNKHLMATPASPDYTDTSHHQTQLYLLIKPLLSFPWITHEIFMEKGCAYKYYRGHCNYAVLR